MSASVALLLTACALLALSGIPGAFLHWRSRAGERIASALCVIASAVGLAAAFPRLVGGGEERFARPWPLPEVSFAVGVDALSAFFLVPVFLMAALGSVYGLAYWRQSEQPGSGRYVRLFWGLLTSGLALLVVARHAFPFLIGWELMALGSFFLIATEDRDEGARSASWIYLVATHVGTLSLFALFAILRGATGSFELRALTTSEATLPVSTAVFLLVLVAFGLKAGIMPFHVWLPPAHANAPSHVSALMSGVVIKMGIYGLVRFTGFLPHPPVAWGALLLVLGVVSGILGVMFALGQHDLKRLLAYHSVENIGIIVIGLGLAMLGRACGRDEWVLLGMAGGLLHVWNHGLFKALLFLSAGSVVHAVRTREIDHLGGLGRRMPWSSFFFLVGAVAICGLPPLNGFISELILYVGLFGTIGDRTAPMAGIAAAGLAMIGALAVACFVKAFGAVFLGEPRGARAARAREASRWMLGPMAVLAVCCAAIGLLPWLLARPLENAVAAWAGPRGSLASHVPLAMAGAFASVLVIGVLLLCLRIGGWLRANRPAADAGTWDCGYARPTARMQYTSSSFAQTIVLLFAWVLRPRVHRPRVTGPFPAAARFESHVDDVALDRAIVPAWNALVRRTRWVRNLQQGRVQQYIAYVLVTVMLLLLAMVPLDRFLLRVFSR